MQAAAAIPAVMRGAIDLAGLRDRAAAAARAQARPTTTPPAGATQAPPADGEHTPPAGPGVTIIDVTEETFQTEVLERSLTTPVVIDFWAPWCGPCRTLGPTLERLAAEAKGAWVLAKVNVDENPRLSQAFRIQSIPAVMAVHQGKVVEQFVGALPESQVRAWLKRFVPEQGGSLLEAAQALEASDPEGAIATRVPVRLGRLSVDKVEVRQGLGAGDRVVLSDTDAWDRHERIRLE